MALYILLILFIITYVIMTQFLRNGNLPPGPRFCLPVIGHFLHISLTRYFGKLEQHELMCKWADRYGKVFSYWLGNQLVVVLNDVKLTREAFSTDDIADRPKAPMIDDVTGGVGVLFGSGHIWREQRKFTLGVFRSLGIGKSSFENVISVEVDHVISEFKAEGQKPFNPQGILNKAGCNVISSVVLGQRFDYDDKPFDNFIKRMHKNAQIVGSGLALIIFPSLKYAPGMSKLLDEYKANLDMNFQFVLDIVKKHRETFDRENPRDLIDSCLQEIEKIENEGSDSSALDEKNLMVTILNLFAAGTETTSATVSWFLLYMITHPDIQHKIHQEIDAAVGRDRLPKISDKSSLPFTEAATLEVLRLLTGIPMAGPHCAARNTKIQGYDIPKGTVVISNLWHMLHDPKDWEDPFEFKPDRFLDEDGKLKSNSDIMVPFGIGRRICLGEQLAKMELFIFITHLMHQFKFELQEESPPVTFKGIFGLTYNPKPYQVIALSR